MLDLPGMLDFSMRDIAHFCALVPGSRLRRYQLEVARRISSAVIGRAGGSFVVVFPRQSGKNELQAHLEAYLLVFFFRGGELVKASPTWKPQSLNAMRRLERVLSRNLLTRRRWRKEQGYVYRDGQARLYFLSGAPSANVVGATANVLLECDEAQDVSPSKWDKDFLPMAASTNAVRVYWGTMWTSKTLLARELRAARQAEEKDGRRRVWVLTAEDVAAEVPAYGQFVAEQLRKLGRNHPLMKTQYFSEEIDAEGGMFDARRVALMRGTHKLLTQPEAGKVYAMTLDVAGEDEAAQDAAAALEGSGGHKTSGMRNPGRDSTALTIFEVDLSTLEDALISAPTYRVVFRSVWTGVKHTTIYGQIRKLAETWRVQAIVVDATGVGAGLASFLDKAFPGKVEPFVFTGKSKSDLGWGFLAVVETGRYAEPDLQKTQIQAKPGASPHDPWITFWQQVAQAQAEVLDGPNKLMRWGVPDGTRVDGELVHDDVLISSALCSVLDDRGWAVTGSPVIVRGVDPLEALSRGF